MQKMWWRDHLLLCLFPLLFSFYPLLFSFIIIFFFTFLSPTVLFFSFLCLLYESAYVECLYASQKFFFFIAYYCVCISMFIETYTCFLPCLDWLTKLWILQTVFTDTCMYRHRQHERLIGSRQSNTILKLILINILQQC